MRQHRQSWLRRRTLNYVITHTLHPSRVRAPIPTSSPAARAASCVALLPKPNPPWRSRCLTPRLRSGVTHSDSPENAQHGQAELSEGYHS
jgi:hypothetical protein